MTAALEGGEWSAVRPGRTLPLRKTRYPFYRRLCGPQGRSGRGGICRPHRDSIPDRPARSSVAISTELSGPPEGTWRPLIISSWEQPASIFCRVSSKALRASPRISKLDQCLIINIWFSCSLNYLLINSTVQENVVSICRFKWNPILLKSWNKNESVCFYKPTM